MKRANRSAGSVRKCSPSTVSSGSMCKSTTLKGHSSVKHAQSHSGKSLWCSGWGLGPSNICNNQHKCVFNKRTIKVCISCFWWCPGTYAPSMAHLTVSLFLCSSESNARGESRAKKSPSRVWDGDEGVAGRNGRENYFPDEGSVICPDLPTRQINDFFYLSGHPNIWLLAPSLVRETMILICIGLGVHKKVLLSRIDWGDLTTFNGFM